MTIGLIGGTGPEGLGLAMRFALSGQEIYVGSRDLQRAEAAADVIRTAVQGKCSDVPILGVENHDAVLQADIVVVVVPYAGHASILTSLRDVIADKILIDAVVPLRFDGACPSIITVAEGSAAQQAQTLLPEARVVGAFHNFSAQKLQDISNPALGDVLVTGDSVDAKDTVINLIGNIGDLRGIDAGPLSLSKFVEDITAVLLSINYRYRSNTSVCVVGLDDSKYQRKD